MRCVWCCAPITEDDLDMGLAREIVRCMDIYMACTGQYEHVAFECDPNYDDGPWNSSGWLDRGLNHG